MKNFTKKKIPTFTSKYLQRKEKIMFKICLNFNHRFAKLVKI